MKKKSILLCSTLVVVAAVVIAGLSANSNAEFSSLNFYDVEALTWCEVQVGDLGQANCVTNESSCSIYRVTVDGNGNEVGRELIATCSGVPESN